MGPPRCVELPAKGHYVLANVHVPTGCIVGKLPADASVCVDNVAELDLEASTGVALACQGDASACLGDQGRMQVVLPQRYRNAYSPRSSMQHGGTQGFHAVPLPPAWPHPCRHTGMASPCLTLPLHATAGA